MDDLGDFEDGVVFFGFVDVEGVVVYLILWCFEYGEKGV